MLWLRGLLLHNHCRLGPLFLTLLSVRFSSQDRDIPYAAAGTGASAEFAAAMERIEADLVNEAGPRGQEGGGRDKQEEQGPLWCAALRLARAPRPHTEPRIVVSGSLRAARCPPRPRPRCRDAFYARFPFAPLRPRPLSQERASAFLRDISAAHLQVIEGAGQAWAEAGSVPAIGEFLWTWFDRIYGNKTAVWVASYCALHGQTGTRSLGAARTIHCDARAFIYPESDRSSARFRVGYCCVGGQNKQIKLTGDSRRPFTLSSPQRSCGP